MSSERLEEVTLVNDSSYLHLRENEQGFMYALFDKESKGEMCDGQIDWTELEDSPIGNPLAAARQFAFEDIGIEAEKVYRVSVNTLEKFTGADVRRRRIWEPETLPEHDIRFINSHYDELFRIPDGGTIQIHYPEETVIKNCFYQDDYHTQVGQNMYHICEFAEIMERRGATYSPEPISMEEQMAWKVGRENYLILQTCDDGWDYTLYDKDFKEVDGGQLDMPDLTMQEARSEILQDFGLGKKDLIVANYDEVVERAEITEAQQHKEIYAEREAKLLAEDIDEFSYSFDPYEYFDSVEDRMEAVKSLEKHIRSGDLKNIKDLLQTAIDEESEYADVAKELIHRLDEYSLKYQSKEKKSSILDKLQEHKIECSENGRKKPTKSREEVR